MDLFPFPNHNIYLFDNALNIFDKDNINIGNVFEENPKVHWQGQISNTIEMLMIPFFFSQ